jgi:hypothetical protein
VSRNEERKRLQEEMGVRAGREGREFGVVRREGAGGRRTHNTLGFFLSVCFVPI